MKLRGGARANPRPNVCYHVCGLAWDHQELGHFEAICITSQRSQKMMWLSGVGASALLRVPTTRTPANAVGHTLAGIELRAAPAAA